MTETYLVSKISLAQPSRCLDFVLIKKIVSSVRFAGEENAWVVLSAAAHSALSRIPVQSWATAVDVVDLYFQAGKLEVGEELGKMDGARDLSEFGKYAAHLSAAHDALFLAVESFWVGLVKVVQAVQKAEAASAGPRSNCLIVDLDFGDIRPGLRTRIINQLDENGIDDVDALCRAVDDFFFHNGKHYAATRIPNLGRLSVSLINEALARIGRHIGDNAKETPAG